MKKLGLVALLAILGSASQSMLGYEMSRENGDEFTPNDPLFVKQWGLKSQTGFDIGATRAWAQEKGSKQVAIVVIDTGIDYNHPDLANNMWTNPNEIPNDGIDNDGNGYIDDMHGINAITGSGDPMDDHSHGTFIAGVIGAEANNGIGIAGIMHNVSLIACKFMDRDGAGATENAIKCLDYVADLAGRDIGVHIIATNNAWGGAPFSQPLLDAIKRHNDLGILFTTTTGGAGRSLDDHPVYPASYELDNIIVAAAMDVNGHISSFSSYGKESVHVAAPGQNIISTIINGGYAIWSGSATTSFVSGVIGLIKSHNLSLTGPEIKQRLMMTALPLATADDQAKIISGGLAHALNALAQ